MTSPARAVRVIPPNRHPAQPSPPLTKAPSSLRTSCTGLLFPIAAARPTSWILKKYKDDAGKPLDLINQKAAAKVGYPLSLWTYDANLRSQLAQAFYVSSATGTLNAPGSLTFTYSSNGLEVNKTFTFDSTYVVHVDLTATDHGNPVTALVAWPSGFGDQETCPIMLPRSSTPCKW